MASQRWIPLESNPAVLNKYMSTLGVDDKWQFVDVWDMDDELLTMEPKPVVAILLLYPLTDKAKETDIGDLDKDFPPDTFFMRQSIGNACGTVALIHAIANNEGTIPIADDKPFRQFLNNTKGKSPEEMAKILEEDQAMGVAHELSANEGDTECQYLVCPSPAAKQALAELAQNVSALSVMAPSRDTCVMQHFVAFIQKDGTLYELDGRKECPVNHGKSSAESFVKDTVKVVKEFMARDPEEIKFNLVALSKFDQ